MIETLPRTNIAEEMEQIEGYEAVGELLASDQEPVLGIYDLGLKFVQPLTHDPAKKEWRSRDDDLKYRDHTIVAFPPGESDARRFLMSEGEHGATLRPTQDFTAAKTGLWSSYTLPLGTWGASHIPRYRPIESEQLSVPAVATTLITGAPELAGQAFTGVFLEQRSCPPTFLVGKEAIIGFVRGSIQGSEASEPKYMPWDQSDYMLPKVDHDIRDIIVSAYLAGIEPTDLPIPEEHRYRVLLSLADGYAWGVVDHRSHLDWILKPPESFRDIGAYESFHITSHPLHVLYRIYKPQTDLKALTEAYQISVDELIEVVKKRWYAQTYWFEKANEYEIDDPALLSHFHNRRPDPTNTERFLEQTSNEDVAYYDSVIEMTVKAGLDPDYLKGDVPPLWR